MDIVHISARSRVCRSCAANSLANSPNICSYHTFKQSHQYRFYGSDATPRTQTPFIGFELEVDRDTVHAPYEYNQGCVYDLGDVFNDFCRYERDASLTRGFEIISHPASLEWLTNNRKMFEDAFDILTNTYRFTSHNNGNCGLHIHVDRTYFENKQDSSLVKLLTLINKFNAEFVKFSRRTQEQLDCYAAMYFDSPESVVLKSKEGSYGRYYALNLSNRDTIEFRLWRGTLKLTTFFATLKFTVRLCELAKEKSSEELLNMTWEELLGDDPDIEAYWASVKQRRA